MPESKYFEPFKFGIPAFPSCNSSRLLAEPNSSISPKQLKRKSKDAMNNIFVGNLSYQTTQEDLLAAFSQFGNVERVNIVTDRDTGQPRGFAFVEMSDPQAARTAIAQLNGAELNGRALNVNEARPKPGGSDGRGGFGGNRRGQGGGRGNRW
jgi:cold-inducible RNA-binding protein